MTSRISSLVLVVLVLAFTGLAGYAANVSFGAKNPNGLPAWTITSPAFRNNARIPMKYTGEGANVSPALNWTIPPQGTVQLALICHDPDAPVGDWVHWVVYSMSATMRALPEGVPTTSTVARLTDLRQGKNGSGTIGYAGPMPPPGKLHHYHFVLYALNTKVDLKPGATRDELTRAMQGHILRKTELIGTYAR